MKKDVIASLPTEILLSVLPDIFILAYVVPLLETHGQNALSDNAQLTALWASVCTQISDDLEDDVLAITKDRLRDILMDCSVPLR